MYKCVYIFSILCNLVCVYIYILICNAVKGVSIYFYYMKQIASPGLMHDAGCSGLVHLDDPEGWDGVFLPRKPCRQRNLAGYNPWVHKESDTT